ncbi:embigin [Osmerus mordax]|uniref:embigin n=1 Tax=Osmerus mordax TaxID=8014 RepID=UPI0035101A36
MSSTWIHSLRIILILLSRGIDTTETPPPLVPDDSPALLEKSVVLKGDSHVENVELLEPTKVKLDCTWTGNKTKLPNITGYWKKDGIEIANTQVRVQLENEQYNLKKVFSINKDNLGDYSCVFVGSQDVAKIDFHLAAPKMSDMRDKPVVSYVGDSVVIDCKSKKPPVYWLWYKVNGTEKELIDTGANASRHGMHVNAEGYHSKLTVLLVNESDAGIYSCSAVFHIGASEGHVELRVITFIEPLKPFLAILVEVVVLVFLILLCEKRNSRKQNHSGNENQSAQTSKLAQGENGMEESSTIRQRKM